MASFAFAKALSIRRLSFFRAAALHGVVLASAFLILRTPVDDLWASTAFAWGVFMIASFAGWGVALEHWLLDGKRLDWGLRCGLGMAFVTVFAGGALALMRLSLRPTLIGIAIAGALLLAHELSKLKMAEDDGRDTSILPSVLFVYAAFAVVLVLVINGMGAGVATIGNGNDDPSYAVIARDFLARGRSIQPFSFRRLCVYGGHEVLLAMFMAPGVPSGFLYMFDAGLCPLIVALVVLGVASTARQMMRPLLILTAAYVLFVPVVQMNIASQGSTLIMVVVLYRVMASDVVRNARLGTAILVALPVAALASLKNSNFVPAALITASALAGYLAASTEPWRTRRDRALTLLGALTVMLAPFAIMSQMSGGSPLFPVTLGNYQADYSFLATTKPTVRQALQSFATSIFGDPKDPQPTWIVMALVLLVADEAMLLAGFFLAPLAVMATLAVATPNALPRDVSRYAYGFQHGVVIAVCLHLATGKIKRVAHVPVAGVIVMAALLLQVRERWAAVGNIQLNYLSQMWERSAPRPDVVEPHVKLQAAAAPGARMLVVVDAPHHFDFRRNRIINFDFPEAVSPPPHIDASRGAGAFAQYLEEKGIRYIAAMKTGASRDLYRRHEFQSLIARSDPYSNMARRTLAALDAIDQLANSRGVAAETDGMMLIDLSARR